MKGDWKYRPVIWEEPIDEEWTVTYHGMRTHRSHDIVIAALEISPSGQTVPSAGVTAQLLRGIKLGTARRVLVALKSLEETIHNPVPLERRKQSPAKTAPPKRDKLRQYLREYEELCVACDPKPAKTLAAKHRVNRSTMRTWLLRAKQL